MQLNMTTDYAIRILICLKSTDNQMTGDEIARTMDIPPKYMRTILKKLLNENIISSKGGVKGGYKLEKELSRITMMDIMRVTESSTKINKCLEENHECRHNEKCPVHVFYESVQKQMENIFAISIEDISKYRALTNSYR